jgi:hypothetical protein
MMPGHVHESPEFALTICHRELKMRLQPYR